jgi:hypothetical protein
MRQRGTLGKIRYQVLIALVCICFTGLAVQPVFAEDSSTISSAMFNFGDALAKMHPELAKMTNLEKAKLAFSEYCRCLDETKQGINVNYWDRMLETGNKIQPDRWTCGDHRDKLKILFAAVGVTKSIDIISDDIDGSHGLNSQHTTIAVVDDNGEVYTFDPWMMAKTNMEEDQGRYTGYPYRWASGSRFNGMPIDDYSRWMSAPLGENYKQFSTDTDNPRKYFTTVREAVNAIPVNVPVTTQQTTAIGRTCSGCDIRTAYEVMGEDMSHCDACPNDERKKK